MLRSLTDNEWAGWPSGLGDWSVDDSDVSFSLRRALLILVALVTAAATVIAAPSDAEAAAPPIVTTGPDARSIDRLYLAYFDRAPDAVGLQFWQSQMAAGASLASVSQNFAGSSEFVNTYGSIDDAAFVRLVYQNVLNRDIDQEGFDHWLGLLTAGRLDRGGLMLEFSDSAEFKNQTGVIAAPTTGADPRSVERLYAAYFDREADAGGLAFWESTWDRTGDLGSISESFAQSDEFQETYGALSNDAFVQLVYRNVLGRTPDADGQAHWQGQLRAGSLSRGQVMLSFSDSAEFKLTTNIHGPRPAREPLPGIDGTAGNPLGTATVPIEAAAVTYSGSDHVIGNGSPASCTSAAVVAAVAQGGIITFDCGPDPITIVMDETAKVRNDRNPDIVIDGGGLVTLSGNGERRILYMNTCDPDQVWTTPHCQNQDHPRLTVQNINFTNGNSTEVYENGGGGGAIFVRGGRFKAVNTIFTQNRCNPTGPDTAGGALRVMSQFDDQPVYITNSTFGGAASSGNQCSNGGAISTIGSSYTILNSVFTHNAALGYGANPAQAGTPGGGNGGAIYNDGGTFHLVVQGTIITDNHAPEGGGGIFYVSNNRQGTMTLDGVTMARNPSDGFETTGLPGIFYLGNGSPVITNSSLQ